ncbi:MAG: hypothetical protein ACT4OD_02160 [Candidatus Nitrosotenuis sp.]
MNKKIQLGKCRLDDIFPQLLVSSSNSTIEIVDSITTAISMLVRLSESLTNNLVVINNGVPVGMLGSREVLRGFIKNPTSNFLHNTIVKNIMNRNPCIVDKNTKFSDLIKKLKKSKNDFAILQDNNNMFSTISIKRILELGLLCDTSVTISQIPKNDTVFCTNNDTIFSLIQTMLETHTTDIAVRNTPFIITGRIILEKIQNELRYSYDIANVLKQRVSDLKPYKATIMYGDLSIPDLCKLMLTVKHPYVMTANQVLTPNDLIAVLS